MPNYTQFFEFLKVLFAPVDVHGRKSSFCSGRDEDVHGHSEFCKTQASQSIPGIGQRACFLVQCIFDDHLEALAFLLQLKNKTGDVALSESSDSTSHRVFLESARPQNICYHLNALALQKLTPDSLECMEAACMHALHLLDSSC